MMDKDEVKRMLMAEEAPGTISAWLRQTYLPEILRRFNDDESRKRFGLYQGEKIPSNERNLTDVRTRMGVLIEFEIARISNEFLQELGIDDIFWSYVVANRFPDLEVRKANGDRLLRLEIKTLECVAEEKSANFDTLIKDINPYTDYVIVGLWEWDNGSSIKYSWDSTPKLFRYYVFNAYTLASMRDTYWLNKPPQNLGGGYQGFDIRFPVTCSEGNYSKEQGNVGKLTRIWTEGFQYRPLDPYGLFDDTEREYVLFEKEIIEQGFSILAHNQLQELTTQNEISPIMRGQEIIGYFANEYGYFLSGNEPEMLRIARRYNLRFLVNMTSKYRSTVFAVQDDGSLYQICNNIKPKFVIDSIRRHCEN